MTNIKGSARITCYLVNLATIYFQDLKVTIAYSVALAIRFGVRAGRRGQGAGGTRRKDDRLYKLRSFPLSPCHLVPLSIPDERTP